MCGLGGVGRWVWWWISRHQKVCDNLETVEPDDYDAIQIGQHRLQ